MGLPEKWGAFFARMEILSFYPKTGLFDKPVFVMGYTFNLLQKHNLLRTIMISAAAGFLQKGR